MSDDKTKAAPESTQGAAADDARARAQSIYMEPVDSALFSHLGHDAASQTMQARFKDSGKDYQVTPVSANEYRALREAKSIGGHYHRIIKAKPGVTVTRIDDDE